MSHCALSGGAVRMIERAAERLLPQIWEGSDEALNQLVMQTRVPLSALLPLDARRDLPPDQWVGEIERAIVEAAALTTHQTCHFACLVRRRMIARQTHRMLCGQSLLAALEELA